MLIKSGVLNPLLDSLSLAAHSTLTSNSSDSDDGTLKLVESCLRALKSILQTPAAPRDAMFQADHAQMLVHLLRTSNSSTANHLTGELAASVIARCCLTRAQQMVFAQLGSVEILVDMLKPENNSKYSSKAREAALDALSELCRENLEICSHVTVVIEAAFSVYVHDRKSAQMRLIACTFLTNVYRAGTVEGVVNMAQSIRTHLLPMLVRFFSEPDMPMKQKATLVLAYLVSDREDMQSAASEAEAIPRIADILLQLPQIAEVSPVKADDEEDTEADRVKESSLLALAAMCSQQDECRKSVFNAKVLPIIIASLSHPTSTRVRLAACQCTRSLSRSIKSLRTSLIDAGVAQPLIKLLSDESTAVQTTASAILCNIVLDFSPMKQTVLANGGVDKLASLVSSMDSNLRLNAAWALKNLLFQADSEVKAKVMSVLTYKTIETLMNDNESNIQEQCLNLLRNLVSGKECDIEAVFDGLGEQKLIAYLDSNLASTNLDLVVQSLYVIVNVSTGSERHKNAIMQNESVLKHILRCMSLPGSDQVAAICTATVWCVINLTWPDDAGSEQRVQRLREFGFDKQLRLLADCSSTDADVRDRVRTAQQHFVQNPSNDRTGSSSIPTGTAAASQRS